MSDNLYDGDIVSIWTDHDILYLSIGYTTIQLDKHTLHDLDKGLAVALLQMQKDAMQLKSWEEIHNTPDDADQHK